MALGSLLPAWSALPFLGLLLSIALFPVVAPKVWHHHYPTIALLWGALLAGPFLWIFRGAAAHELWHTALTEYGPFVLLLAALFTIGGGIHLHGRLPETPLANAAFLGVGTLLASLLGTTGASMILIRPLLKAHASRRHRAHTVVFFILLVGNLGGALTPLGDPPLFLGFLAGVPFFWTLSLALPMLFAAALVLLAYLIFEGFLGHPRSHPKPRQSRRGREVPPEQRLRLEGGHNLFYLAGVLAAVLLSGLWHPGEVSLFGVSEPLENLARDLLLLGLLLASWKTTPRPVREANHFSWAPIREVAILFAAIFATLLPVLAILKAGPQGALAPVLAAVATPRQYFWVTGALSSVLDNAPTYLAFLSTVLGRFSPGVPERTAVLRLIAEHPEYLRAISAGAVFMGANTYLGNAPNLMVRSIAEEAGVPMPSFLGYLGRYSLPILLPIFLLTGWVFF
ncbi:MAG TPA: sodium:proton antiporter [Thermoanaerobaculia bacterium]|nr:sodium:proton antiporter [Thermoanaerobaculia bacterium]